MRKNKKTVWLPDDENKIEDMFIRFDWMYQRDNKRTDGHRMSGLLTAKAALA